MLPKWHILSGLIFSILLYVFLPINFFEASIVFLASFLIDFDHYLYYAFIKKDLSPKNSYLWFMENKIKYNSISKERRKKIYIALCWFHGVELMVALFFAAFFFKLLLFVLLGFVFHFVLDLIYAALLDDMGHTFSFLYKFIKTRTFQHIEDVK